MSKINFNEFKNKDKVNLEEIKTGGFKVSSKTLSDYFLEDKKNDKLKIVLTKIGLLEGDNIIITSYDPEGDIEQSTFVINHFCYIENKYYEIKIEHRKKDTNFLNRMLKSKKSKRYWRIEICELSARSGKSIRTCEVRDIDTNESLEISLKLDKINDSVKKKIFELLRGFKYDRLKLKLEQRMLFDEKQNIIDVPMRRDISASEYRRV